MIGPMEDIKAYSNHYKNDTRDNPLNDKGDGFFSCVGRFRSFCEIS